MLKFEGLAEQLVRAAERLDGPWEHPQGELPPAAAGSDLRRRAEH